MVSTKKNEDAVSPVIGTILMVAVTVLLAGIVAYYVFGMASSNLATPKNVGLTFSQNASSYGVVTVQGGTSLPQLSNLTYNINGGAEILFNPVPTYPLTAGRMVSTAAAITAGQKVMIIGHFSDGSTQVLVEQQF